MKKLEILIGDDCFADLSTAKSAISNMFVAMAETANYREAFPIRIEQEDNIYVGRNIVPYASEIRVTAVKSVAEMISEAQNGNYDIIITDLEYGQFGGESGGIDVIDNVTSNATIALCTSSTNKKLLTDLRSRVDILAAPELEENYSLLLGGGKFGLVGEKLSKHYVVSETRGE
jgi:hypothetical protein